MPKSKRQKIIALTQTKPKGKDKKATQLEEISNALEEFQYVYLFELENARNSLLKEVRSEWTNNSNSRFFFGKNSLMQIALGKSEEDEPKPNLHLVADRIAGHCGLFMSNEPADKVIEWFASYGEKDYPRSGFESTQEVVLEEGPLPQFSHAIEPHLRSLGMPTELKQGIVNIRHKYTVCRVGDVLNPDQCKILKLLDIKMSTFKFTFKCYWSKGKFFDLEASKMDQ
jgi:mRNA turnover protein 4